jgi:hypothetical protein
MVQLLVALRCGAELALIEQAVHPRQGSPGFHALGREAARTCNGKWLSAAEERR